MSLCVLSEERVTPCLPSVNRGTGTTPLGLGNPGGRLPRVSSLAAVHTSASGLSKNLEILRVLAEKAMSLYCYRSSLLKEVLWFAN